MPRARALGVLKFVNGLVGFSNWSNCYKSLQVRDADGTHNSSPANMQGGVFSVFFGRRFLDTHYKTTFLIHFFFPNHLRCGALDNFCLAVFFGHLFGIQSAFFLYHQTHPTATMPLQIVSRGDDF